MELFFATAQARQDTAPQTEDPELGDDAILVEVGSTLRRAATALAPFTLSFPTCQCAPAAGPSMRGKSVPAVGALEVALLCCSGEGPPSRQGGGEGMCCFSP